MLHKYVHKIGKEWICQGKTNLITLFMTGIVPFAYLSNKSFGKQLSF